MKKNLISVLALLLTALMLCSCAGGGKPSDTGTEKATGSESSSETKPSEKPTESEESTETSEQPPEESTVPPDVEILDNPIAIAMLRNTSFAQDIAARGDIGLSRVWDVGVKQDRFENEEILTVPTDAKVYEAADYGITPDGVYNSARLNKLLDDLSDTEGNKVVHFAGETYPFSSAIELLGMKDLWLVGEKDTLFLFDGWGSYIRASLSENINMKNISFDMKYSPTIAGTITKVDESGADPVITIRVADEFDLTASVYRNRLKVASSYMECYLDESTGKYTPDFEGNLFYNTATANTSLFGIGDLSYNAETRELSIPLLHGFPWWTYRTPEIGTMVSFAYTMYDNTGMVFKNCEQVTVENVNVYVAGGMGFRVESGKNYYLNRFNFMQKPGSARIMTCTADIIHTIAVEGDLKITNCLLESSHDDALNIKSFYTQITATSAAERTITVSQTQNEVAVSFDVGDTVEIYDPSMMQLLASYTVTATEKRGTNYILTLDKRPKSDFVGMSCGNVTKSTHLSLDNCIIQNKRNRGILLQCRESEIVNCTFRNIIMGAVQVLSVNDDFREAILPQNIRIENCKFLNNITDVSIFCYGDGTTHAVAGTLKDTFVQNCYFFGGRGTHVNLQATGNSQIRHCLFDLADNTVSNVLKLYKAKDTVFSDNHVYTTYRGYNLVNLTDSESDCTKSNNIETKH